MTGASIRLRFRRHLLGVVLLAAVASCGAPSEEEVQREFNEFVSSRRSCDTAADCVAVSPGCPLGCWVAVSRSAQGAVERKARDLIDDYESGGRSCAYGCIEAGALLCEEGRCGLEE